MILYLYERSVNMRMVSSPPELTQMRIDRPEIGIHTVPRGIEAHSSYSVSRISCHKRKALRSKKVFIWTGYTKLFVTCTLDHEITVLQETYRWFQFVTLTVVSLTK